MDSNTSIINKTLCCTCLSTSRKLFQLCRINNGVNNLYSLLSYDSEAYREGFYQNTASLFICWECKALVKKFALFQKQVCKAQKLISSIIDDDKEIKATKLCLSNLVITYKDKYDKQLEFAPFNADDNFIDCGPMTCNESIKDENDYDEMPLSELVGSTDIINRDSIEDLDNSPRNFETDNVIKNETSDKTENGRNGLDGKQNLEGKLKKRKHKNGNVADKTSKLNANGKVKSKKGLLYKCKECDLQFRNRSTRWRHVQKCHAIGYECSDCGKQFTLKYNFTRHVQKHLATPPRVECKVCHKMIRVDLTKAHQMIHQPRTKYSCLECEKVFVSKASYEHHLKFTQAHCDSIHNVLKYKCNHCGKGYRSRGELRDHINYQHFSTTDHKCPICNKALATQRCITRHVKRAHQGIKESNKDKICLKCGKAFRDKKRLREHEFIHTGERPLSCEICGCTFRQTASLSNHKKRLHNIVSRKINLKLNTK